MEMQTKQSGSGWRAFAGVIIALVGIFNFIDGLVTLTTPGYFSFYSDGYTHHLVFGSLRPWGWAFLILGLIQFLAALAIFARRGWGAVVGIVVASLGAIGQLLYLAVDPWWSVIVIAFDVLIIYALAVYGFPERS